MRRPFFVPRTASLYRRPPGGGAGPQGRRGWPGKGRGPCITPSFAWRRPTFCAHRKSPKAKGSAFGERVFPDPISFDSAKRNGVGPPKKSASLVLRCIPLWTGARGQDTRSNPFRCRFIAPCFNICIPITAPCLSCFRNRRALWAWRFASTVCWALSPSGPWWSARPSPACSRRASWARPSPTIASAAAAESGALCFSLPQRRTGWGAVLILLSRKNGGP